MQHQHRPPRNSLGTQLKKVPEIRAPDKPCNLKQIFDQNSEEEKKKKMSGFEDIKIAMDVTVLNI